MQHSSSSDVRRSITVVPFPRPVSQQPYCSPYQARLHKLALYWLGIDWCDQLIMEALGEAQ